MRWKGLHACTHARIALTPTVHPSTHLSLCHHTTHTERSQLAPIYASDLQSISWGAHALGGIMGCTTVGQAQAHLHSRGVFGLASLTPAVIMVLAALRWLPERRVPLAERGNSCKKGFRGGQRCVGGMCVCMDQRESEREREERAASKHRPCM